MSKKRLRAESNAIKAPALKPEPIVFRFPGLIADARLVVFEQEFHVHSIVLKFHSAFFRKFLDSAEKNVNLSTPFKYEYTTVVDDDGVWALEPVSHATHSTSEMLSCVDSVEDERLMFGTLLRAMYNRPYTIDNVKSLQTIFQLADFYCALPVLSAGLTGALISGKMFSASGNETSSIYDKFAEESEGLIVIAKKLRHKLLFEECFVHVVSRWEGNKKTFIEHPDIRLLVDNAYGQLCRKVTLIHSQIMASSKYFDGLLGGAHAEPTYNAIFFRSILERIGGNPSAWNPERRELKLKLDEILISELVLDRTSIQAGKGTFQYLLCTKIAEEDLPWDLKEVDS